MRSDAAEALGAEWLPLRPNTDVVPMLGLAHTLIAENLYDRAFLDTYTVGFARLRAYVVEVECFDGKVLEITVFAPPRSVQS